MTTIEQILAIIVINRDINPRKKYDDKCFKLPEAFHHHLVMSIETPCTGNIQTYGVKDAIKNALSSLRHRNDFSELFEVLAEIKSICSNEEIEEHSTRILEKLNKYKSVAKSNIGLIFARHVPVNATLTQHDVYEVVDKYISKPDCKWDEVWNLIVDELWHNYGTGYEKLINQLNPEYNDARSFNDVMNNVKTMTHQLYKWEQNAMKGGEPFIPGLEEMFQKGIPELKNDEEYAELLRLGNMSRNAMMEQNVFTQLQLAPYITASPEVRLKFLYNHILHKRERKEVEISVACDKVMNYLTYYRTGNDHVDTEECLKFIEDITTDQFRAKMAEQNYVVAPDTAYKVDIIKMGIAKMSKQTEKPNVTLVNDKNILKTMRPRFNILDDEFDLLSTIVLMPVETLVELGIFTQGIVDKILAGGSDHQRVHLAHREIDFGIGFPKAATLVYTPTPVTISKLVTVDPAINYVDTRMDNSAFHLCQKFEPADKQSVSIQNLAKKTLEKEKDKELVLKSFITFVKEELSDDHDSDVQTALEILQDYFTVEELFGKLTGCELPVGHQFLGWKNVSGITLKELVSHTITISRKVQQVANNCPDFSKPLVISLDPSNQKDLCKMQEQWLTQNCFPISPTQEALKTKRPDYESGNQSNVLNIKLFDNNHWGDVARGFVKLFENCTEEHLVKAEETFASVINQILAGSISYEEVKETLIVPNIRTNNKYNTKYILQQLGGSDAVANVIDSILEKMDEHEARAILKFQIGLYQQAAGKFHTDLKRQIRKQVAIFLDNIFKEALKVHKSTNSIGISRHYKDGDLEMVIVCKLSYDNFGFPIWKTRVDIVRSKHFAAGQSLQFPSVEFHYDEDGYRGKVMEKLLCD